MNLQKIYVTACLIFSFGGVLFWVSKHSSLRESQSQRGIASIEPADITRDLLRFKNTFTSNAFRIETCERILQSEFEKLTRYNFREFNIQSIQPTAFQLMNQVFSIRTDLRERMIQLLSPAIRSDSLTESDRSQIEKCAWAFRRAFRGMRVLEDYLGEASAGFPFDRERGAGGSQASKASIMPAFQGGPTFLLWNRKFNLPGAQYVPRSGDIILSRGTASTSAAIARISDEDTNFSHLSIVWIDPDTSKPEHQRIQTIEAHIEIGTDLFSWNQYVSDEKVRAVVFRYNNPDQEDEKDAEIAHAAASKIRHIALNHKAKKGSRICYDFTMNMNDRTCIFCSEIIRIAFEDAGISGIPLFPSPINPKNRNFVEKIGVTERVTFAPADIEIDPRFDLIAEWRDHHRIHRTHFMDAVLTSMYRWMDDMNYELYPSGEHKFLASFGYTLRRIPLLDRTVKAQFPLNMKKDAIETVQVLNTVVNRLADYIDLEEQKLLHSGPKRYSPREMAETLEYYRTEDLRYYQQYLQGLQGQLPKTVPKTHFHSFLRARDP